MAGLGGVRFGRDRLKVIGYCAEECRRQRSGESSVLWMVHGWEFAVIRVDQGALQPTEEDILRLGRWIEPQQNADGYRRVNVRVGRSIKMPHYNVPLAMEELLDLLGRLSPAEWYHRYEEIHPFVDGNGRTGKILFNWLGGTLANPTDPPNFWEDEGPPLPVSDLPEFFLEAPVE